MPAKKKLLPRPCPICGNLYGSIQIVIFSSSSNLICRIGHYDKEKYQNPSNVRERKSRGKKWCSFNISRLFAKENMSQLEQHMNGLSAGYFGKRKSKTYTNPMFLLEAIKEDRWHGEGIKYLRAVSK